MTVCPNCGKALTYFMGPADSAPWLCRNCARGWWQTDLAPAAQQAWMPELRSHRLEDAPDLHDAAVDERDSARVRGVSIRPDMLELLSTDDLTALVTLWGPRLASGFLTSAQAALTARG